MRLRYERINREVWRVMRMIILVEIVREWWRRTISFVRLAFEIVAFVCISWSDGMVVHIGIPVGLLAGGAAVALISVIPEMHSLLLRADYLALMNALKFFTYASIALVAAGIFARLQYVEGENIYASVTAIGIRGSSVWLCMRGGYFFFTALNYAQDCMDGLVYHVKLPPYF